MIARKEIIMRAISMSQHTNYTSKMMPFLEEKAMNTKYKLMEKWTRVSLLARDCLFNKP